jgi:SM-20-related protein
LRSLDPALAGYLRDDERVPSPDAGTSVVVERESLAPLWNDFAAQLLSPDYRSAIGRIAGLDLSNAPLQADLEVGEPGSWYHAHRDLGRRAVSHIFYFNPEWDTRWGGCLRILRTRDIEAVVDEIVPLSNTSVVLVHRGALWHGTLPIARAAAARRSLHVWFWA